MNKKCGIWELDGYQNLTDKILDALESGLEKQDFVPEQDITVEEILIFGSYGNGTGIPYESDLDIMVLVSYDGNIRSHDYSECMKALAGAVNYNQSQIVSTIQCITEIETYVYPVLEKQKHLTQMAMNGSVETYYNLTTGSKESYYHSQ